MISAHIIPSSIGLRALVSIRPRWWCFWRLTEDYEAYAIPRWSVGGYTWYRYGRRDRDTPVSSRVQLMLEVARLVIVERRLA